MRRLLPVGLHIGGSGEGLQPCRGEPRRQAALHLDAGNEAALYRWRATWVAGGGDREKEDGRRHAGNSSPVRVPRGIRRGIAPARGPHGQQQRVSGGDEWLAG